MNAGCGVAQSLTMHAGHGVHAATRGIEVYGAATCTKHKPLPLTPDPTSVARSDDLYEMRIESANYLTLASNAMGGAAADVSNLEQDRDRCFDMEACLRRKARRASKAHQRRRTQCAGSQSQYESQFVPSASELVCAPMTQAAL
jgi:hypothetical protein